MLQMDISLAGFDIILAINSVSIDDKTGYFKHVIGKAL